MDYTLDLLGMVLLTLCHCTYTEKPFRDLYTAGNTKCRTGHDCELRGYSYRWCYVDTINNWDYCCSDECALRGLGHTWCNSGSRTLEKCTDPSFTAEKGQTCIPEFPCGLHGEVSNNFKFWCYVNEKRDRWVPCCPPYTPNGAVGCIM